MPRRTLRSERSNRGGSSVVVMQSGGGGSSNLAGSAIDLNFASGQYFGVTGSPTTFLTTTRASNKTNLFPTSASGFAYSTFTNNVPAITPGSGLSVEEARTNVLLNSTVPATQTTASLGTGTYTLWVNGSGSATSSAGTATITGAGAATNGSPNVFAVTVAGTVTITVGGSLNAFQCELGVFGTSFIVTAGATATRSTDFIVLASPPALGSSYSLFAQGAPQATAAFASNQVAASISDGSINNRFQLYRANTTANSGSVVGSGGVTQYNQTDGNWVQGTPGKIAGAITAGDQQAVFNATLMTSGAGIMPITPTTVGIGNLANSSYYNGFVMRIALWPSTRISNALMQSITVSLTFIITLDGSPLSGLVDLITGLP